MSATMDATGFERLDGPVLVECFYAMALCEAEGDDATPWGMRTPEARREMRRTFREIAERWIPADVWLAAADGLCDDDLASIRRRLLPGGRDAR